VLEKKVNIQMYEHCSEHNRLVLDFYGTEINNISGGNLVYKEGLCSVEATWLCDV
jgi:hypothetical protein